MEQQNELKRLIEEADILSSKNKQHYCIIQTSADELRVAPAGHLPAGWRVLERIGPTMTPKAFKKAQARLGKNNQQMADALGLSRSMIVKLRGGKHPISKTVDLAIRWLLL